MPNVGSASEQSSRLNSAYYSMIDDLVVKHDDANVMLIHGEQNRTVGEMREAASRLASGLLSDGVQPGDRVGVVAPQSYEAAICHLAILWAGAVSVPLSVREDPGSVTAKLVRVGAKAAFVGPSAGLEDAPFRTVDTASDVFNGMLDREEVPYYRSSPNDPAVIIFTSGTTGAPRGAIIPHRVLPARLPAFCSAQDGAPMDGDRFWTPVEWTWVGSLIDSLFTPWAVGIPVVVHEGKFDPAQAAALIEKQSIRNVFLPPTALRMMQSAGVQLSKPIRAIHSGGEALTPECIEWAEAALGARPNEIYGQTEASFLVGSGQGNPPRPGMIGRAYPGHAVTLLDPEDNDPTPVGSVGEICVPSHDPCVFLGYWGEPPGSDDGWWRTGDLAVSDADGYLRFVSRKDDLIVSSGYRVDPLQIERALLSHEAIEHAAVIGVSDPVRGQVPRAYVTLRETTGDHNGIIDALTKWTEGKIPGYARPSAIEVVDSMPLTPTGKVARARLRAERAGDLTR